MFPRHLHGTGGSVRNNEDGKECFPRCQGTTGDHHSKSSGIRVLDIPSHLHVSRNKSVFAVSIKEAKVGLENDTLKSYKCEKRHDLRAAFRMYLGLYLIE